MIFSHGITEVIIINGPEFSSDERVSVNIFEDSSVEFQYWVGSFDTITILWYETFWASSNTIVSI